MMNTTTPAPETSANVSFAQHFEDVRLWKALQNWPHRIYVDIGAGHPHLLSVTRLFYERGWRGINVEPGPHFPLLAADRPQDQNVQAVICDHTGTVPFHITSPHPDLSSIHTTLLTSPKIQHVETVQWTSYRLADLLQEYLPDTPIGFLKIDVEGAEKQVIESNDWTRFVPAVVIVEAIHPQTGAPNYAEWEPHLLPHGYRMVHDDGINRFYLHNSAAQLESALRAPVTPLDGFAPFVWLQEGRKQVAIQDLEAGRMALKKIAQFDYTNKEHFVKNRNKDNYLSLILEKLKLAEHRARQLEHRLAAIESSRVWRLTQAATYRLPLVERGIRAVARWRQQRASRPRRVRAVYEQYTIAGAPLEPVCNPPACPARLSAHPIDQLRQTRLQHGPALLSDADWQTFRTAPQEPAAIAEWIRTLLDQLHTPKACPAEGTVPDLFLIDAGPLQIPNWCGIKTHSLQIVREFSRCLQERGIPFAFLTHSSLPPLADDLSALATRCWTPNHLHQVRVFLRLAPFLQADHPTVIDLMRMPDVRRCAVWLDGIVSLYPAFFLPNADTFWMHQLGLEQLSRCELLLPISNAAAQEALSFLQPAPDLLMTRCLSSLPAVDTPPPSPPLPFQRFALITANWLPHKNPLTVVLACAHIIHRHHALEGLVIVAQLRDDQRVALETAARACGLSPEHLFFATSLSTDEMTGLMAAATVVVVPSLHEGFSLPIVEALALNTPVLASDIPAHRELLDQPEDLFPPADPITLAERLNALLADPETALERQKQSLERNYQPQVFAEAITAAVDRLTRSWPAPQPVQPEPAPVTTVAHPFSLCKVCEVEDFAHPRLQPLIRDIFAHERERFGTAYPIGHEHRKHWEVAMAIGAFREAGLLTESHDFLGIGAGNEPTVFYLTRYARRVLATDLYLGEGWEESASASMLSDPGWHWPFFWRPERLQVAHMNALHLDLPDESFDGIFSSSSIEHFGDHKDVARSLDEMYRVLKPGGILSLSTEFRLTGPAPGIPHVLMFETQDVEQLIVGTRKWELVEPFRPDCSPRTRETIVDHAQACREQQHVVERIGALWPHHMTYSVYPHIVMQIPSHTFTSFHIALRKQP